MTVEILCYRPKEGGDLAIKVLKDGVNQSATIALQLHRLYDEECRRLDRLRRVFRPNLVYEFAFGLVFRIFDGGVGVPQQCLDFLVVPEARPEKTAILAQIPRLLRACGVEDEAALNALYKFIRQTTPEGEAMYPTCAQCGAILSLPGDYCQQCGHLINRTLQPPSTQPYEDGTATGPPPTGPAPEEETAKVDNLLRHIASQSHFEERYELRGMLAQGGMGHIYHGYDRILRREVAIKMMSVAQGGDTTAPLRGQFLKEARVGGRLLHPHILAVFDLGVNRSVQIYYTMRLVDGASLQHCLDSLDRGVVITKLVSYPLRKLVEALVKACHGVDYAHQNGVIHLDLKPQNILYSGFNEVFVIDWGLARVDEVDDTDELVDLYRERGNSLLTASNTGVFGGQAVGTPAYMAPEQAAGDYSALGAATDVYGLGGILYFILYGKAPNQGGSIPEILASSVKPKRKGTLRQGILPRGQPVRRADQDALAALEAICLRALEPDQTKRYPDAEKLLVELNEWLANTPGPPL